MLILLSERFLGMFYNVYIINGVYISIISIGYEFNEILIELKLHLAT